MAGGYLAQNESTNRYYLGRSALLLGQVAQRNLGLEHAHSVLERLGEGTGESLNLGVRDGDGVVVALRVPSPDALRFDQPPGTRVALDCSAMGKALLAFGPDAGAVLARLGPLEARTPHTHTDPRAVLAELEATRRRGWSMDDEESVVGVRCVRAPVLDGAGRPRAAIALQAPAARMPHSRIEALAPSVVAAATEIAGAMPPGRALDGPPGRQPRAWRRSLRARLTTPAVITVAITGSVPTKDDNPALPVEPAEQVELPRAAFEAGASVLPHPRARRRPVRSSSDPELFPPGPGRPPRALPGHDHPVLHGVRGRVRPRTHPTGGASCAPTWPRSPRARRLPHGHLRDDPELVDGYSRRMLALASSPRSTSSTCAMLRSADPRRAPASSCCPCTYSSC